MGKKKWACIIAAVLVVAVGVSVAILLMTRNGGEGGGKASAPEDVEKMIQQYEEMKRLAEQAFNEMQDLESEQAVEDAQTYANEIEEAYEDIEELYDELDEVVQETEDAVDELSGYYEEYEALYNEMLSFYMQLEKMCEQGKSVLAYLESLVPLLKDMQQLESMAGKVLKAPAAIQQGEAMQEIVERSAGIAELTKITVPAPQTMAGFQEGMQAYSSEIQSITGQMVEALASGNRQAAAGLIDQLNRSISGIQSQLTAAVASSLNEILSQLNGISAGVESLLP